MIIFTISVNVYDNVIDKMNKTIFLKIVYYEKTAQHSEAIITFKQTHTIKSIFFYFTYCIIIKNYEIERALYKTNEMFLV